MTTSQMMLLGGAQHDPYWSSVILLMKASVGAVDLSSYARTVTANNNAATSSMQSKFNGMAFSFMNSGSNDAYYTFSGPSDFAFGSVDYTLESWVWAASGNNDIASSGISTTTDRGWGLSGQRPGDWKGNGGAAVLQNTETSSLSSWHHIAWARASNTLRAFIDGTVCVATATDSDTLTASAPRVGASAYIPYETTCNAYMDQIRLTKGVARYTSNFIAPTAPFPNG